MITPTTEAITLPAVAVAIPVAIAVAAARTIGKGDMSTAMSIAMNSYRVHACRPEDRVQYGGTMLGTMFWPTYMHIFGNDLK